MKATTPTEEYDIREHYRECLTRLSGMKVELLEMITELEETYKAEYDGTSAAMSEEDGLPEVGPEHDGDEEDHDNALWDLYLLTLAALIPDDKEMTTRLAVEIAHDAMEIAKEFLKEWGSRHA